MGNYGFPNTESLTRKRFAQESRVVGGVWPEDPYFFEPPDNIAVDFWPVADLHLHRTLAKHRIWPVAHGTEKSHSKLVLSDIALESRSIGLSSGSLTAIPVGKANHAGTMSRAPSPLAQAPDAFRVFQRLFPSEFAAGLGRAFAARARDR